MRAPIHIICISYLTDSMTIKRQFKTIELKNGKTIRTVVFDDPQYALLTTVFIADYNAFSEWIDRNMLDVPEG